MTTVCVIAEGVSLVALLVAAVAYALHLVYPERHFGRLGAVTLSVAVVLLATGLLAHSTRQQGALGDFANVSFIFVLLLAGGVWYLDRRAHRPALAALVAPLMFLVALLGLLESTRAVPAIADHPWLALHVVLSLTSYACFGVAAVLAVAYLVSDYLLKQKRLAKLPLFPPLSSADRIGYGAVLTGWSLFTLGLLIGAFTVFSWGTGSDAKIVVSCALWLYYTAYLVLRHFSGWRGRRLQWPMVVGFMLVIVSFAAVGHNPNQLRQSRPTAVSADPAQEL